VRGTLDLLGKIFLFRSCEGPEPGRRSGSPCLDYYIKRCGAPCVGYVSKEEYRAGIDGVIAFLSGRFRQIERELETRMHFAVRPARLRAGDDRAQPPAGGARAARAPARRRRPRRHLRRVAIAVDATEANAQVFQVRDGVLSDRRASTSTTRASTTSRAPRGVPASSTTRARCRSRR
jgi:excinuclease ABC subunit C